MENLSLEEKIASFKKKIEDLGHSVPAVSALGRPEQSAEAALSGEAPELDDGKAVKRRLSSEHLSESNVLPPDTAADVDINVSPAAAAAAGGKGQVAADGSLDEDGEADDYGGESSTDVNPPGAADVDVGESSSAATASGGGQVAAGGSGDEGSEADVDEGESSATAAAAGEEGQAATDGSGDECDRTDLDEGQASVDVLPHDAADVDEGDLPATATASGEGQVATDGFGGESSEASGDVGELTAEVLPRDDAVDVDVRESSATTAAAAGEEGQVATDASGDGGGRAPAEAEAEKAAKLAAEFEKGKIAAMKNRLVSMGLGIDGKGPPAGGAKGDGVEPVSPSAGAATTSADGEDAEKAAKLAAEFEKGKIAAMKNRLVSMGLGIDRGSKEGAKDHATVAKASHTQAKDPTDASNVGSDMPATASNDGKEDGPDRGLAPLDPAPAKDEDVAVDSTAGEDEPPILMENSSNGGVGSAADTSAATEDEEMAAETADGESEPLADAVADAEKSSIEVVRSETPGATGNAMGEDGSNGGVAPDTTAAAEDEKVVADPDAGESEAPLSDAESVEKDREIENVASETPDVDGNDAEDSSKSDLAPDTTAAAEDEEVAPDLADGEPDAPLSDAEAAAEDPDVENVALERPDVDVNAMEDESYSRLAPDAPTATDDEEVATDLADGEPDAPLSDAEAAAEDPDVENVDLERPDIDVNAVEDNSHGGMAPDAPTAAEDEEMGSDPDAGESEAYLAETGAVAEVLEVTSAPSMTPDSGGNASEEDGSHGALAQTAPSAAEGEGVTGDTAAGQESESSLADAEKIAGDAGVMSASSKTPTTAGNPVEEDDSHRGLGADTPAAAEDEEVVVDPESGKSERPLGDTVTVSERTGVVSMSSETPNTAGNSVKEEGMHGDLTPNIPVVTDEEVAVDVPREVSRPPFADTEEVVAGGKGVASASSETLDTAVNEIEGDSSNGDLAPETHAATEDEEAAVDPEAGNTEPSLPDAVAVADEPNAGSKGSIAVGVAPGHSSADGEEAQATAAPPIAPVPGEDSDAALTEAKTKPEQKEETPAVNDMKRKAPMASSGPSPKIERFNVAASKAKAALAAAKQRSRNNALQTAATPSPGGGAREPRRRKSTSERKKASKRSPGSRSSNISPARKQSPGMPTREGRQPSQPRSTLSPPVRVSPGTGDVSRAVPAYAVTPGLHPKAPESGAEPSHKLLRGGSPARQKRGISSAGTAVTPATTGRSPGAVMTPTSAEASGNRLHEQAKEAMERLERRRREEGVVVPPPVIPDSLTPPTKTVVTLTPASAEASGNRLHEQAKEARERLERRRSEAAVPSSLTTMPGLTPFTSKRLSNPYVAPGSSPAVTGADRLESLYLDAIQRNSRLEMARRAEEEKPRQCTFSPVISKRGRTLVRGTRNEDWDAEGEADGRGRDASRGGGGLSSTFDALYRDAKRRREKIEALKGAQERGARPPSPVITAMARQVTNTPVDVRMRENAERWLRRWQELEEKKIEQEKEGCTFMPAVALSRSSSAPRMRPGQKSTDSGGSSSGGGGIEAFVERSVRFREARERNMEKLKQEAEERQRAEATFKPRILPWTGDDSASAGTGGSVAGGVDVFERLIRAAENQEMNKAALKQEFLNKEREEFNNFEPRLPTKQADGRIDPLDTRIKKSTDEWIKSKELREKRRLELEAEECTFRPSLGGGGGGGGSVRRSSSVDSRPRTGSSRPAKASSREESGVGPAAVTAFAARGAAFLQSKEQRLETLRKEKARLELQEATFQPVIGTESRRARGEGNGWTNGTGASRVRDASTSGEALVSEAQKAVPAAPEQKRVSVGFKSDGATVTASSRQQSGGVQTAPALAADKAGATPPLPPHKKEEEEVRAKQADEELVTSTVTETVEQGVDLDELSARLQELVTVSSSRDEEGDLEESEVPPAALPTVCRNEPRDGQGGDDDEEEEEENVAGVDANANANANNIAVLSSGADDSAAEETFSGVPSEVDSPKAHEPLVKWEAGENDDEDVMWEAGKGGVEKEGQGDREFAGVDDEGGEQEDEEDEGEGGGGGGEGEEVYGQEGEEEYGQEGEEEYGQEGEEEYGQEEDYDEVVESEEGSEYNGYAGRAHGSPEQSSQTQRSLEDFDRAQREIAEKMRSLGLGL